MEFDTPKVASDTKVISPRGLDVDVERTGGPQFPVPDVPSLEGREKRYKAGEDKEHVLKPTDLTKLSTIGITEKVALSLSSPIVKYVEPQPHVVIEAAKIMEAQLNDFDYGISVVIDALNEVAKIHPFVATAVIAFGAVYKLETTRRDNDNKVKLLYVEMKEMMRVLLRLRTMKQIEGDKQCRLELISKATANDIKEGANACETYLKKKLVVKFLKSPLWEKRFSDLFKKYSDRRKEFEFELTVRSGVIGDEVLAKVSHVHDGQAELLQSVRMMAAIFEKALSPDQAKLRKLVMDKCGPDGTRDEAQLRQLLKDKPALIEGESRAGAPQKSSKAKDEKSGIDEVLKEIKDMATDTHTDEVKNMEYFERKFAMQSAQIVSAMEDIVVRESDRVITAIISGPQDRILDKDMHNLWKEMRWGGHVKANHFILALRDYYQQKVETRKLAIKKGETVDPDPDEWAYRHINIPYLQHLIEAIDDDASGFITISELNKFTSSRPKDWSLPHWLAYWAVGWFTTIRDEKGKIISIFDKLYGLLPKLLPENQPFAIHYLQIVWRKVSDYVYSLNAVEVPDNIEGKFKHYVNEEEKRLRTTLEDIKYNIKDMESLYLISGPGSIEKHFFPLTRLLLERHLEIFQLCKTRVVDDYELRDAADTIEWAYDAVWYRHKDLTAIFKGQRRDLEVEFGTYAFGLYEYMNKPSLLWAKRFKDTTFDSDDSGSDDSDSDSDSDSDESNAESDNEEKDPKEESDEKEPAKVAKPTEKKAKSAEEILCHPEDIIDYPPYEEPLNCADYDGAARIISDDFMSGDWSGLLYNSKEAISTYCPMMPFAVVADPTEEHPHQFRMTGISFRGVAYTCVGTYSETEHKTTFDIKFRYWQETQPDNIIYHAGQLDILAGSISGTWGDEEESSDHDGIFVMKRTPPQILRFRPSPSVITENKPKALWSYATQAVLHQVRKQRWSWSFFRERRDIRRQYLALALRSAGFGQPCSSEEKKEFARLRQLLSHFDARFYHQLRLRKERPLVTKSGFTCDGCGKDINIRFPGRIMCLDCEVGSGLTSSIDFCLNMDCLRKPINDTEDDLDDPHLPTHRVLLLRRELLLRNKVKEMKQAKEAISRGEKKVKRALNEDSDSDDSDDSSSEETGSETSSETSSETASEASSVSTSHDKQDISSGDSDDVLNDKSESPTAHEVDSDEEKADTDTTASENDIEEKSTAPAAEEGKEENSTPASETGKSDHKEGLKCGVCDGTLERPCWYCVECIDHDVFICVECNVKGGVTLEKFGHDQFHSLVLIRDEEESDDDDENTLEKRVDSLQEKLESVENHMQDMKERQGRVEDHFQDVKERQSRVEGHIQTLIERQTRIEDMLTKLCNALVK